MAGLDFDPAGNGRVEVTLPGLWQGWILTLPGKAGFKFDPAGAVAGLDFDPAGNSRVEVKLFDPAGAVAGLDFDPAGNGRVEV